VKPEKEEEEEEKEEEEKGKLTWCGRSCWSGSWSTRG
jgi:hypothetical protein